MITLQYEPIKLICNSNEGPLLVRAMFLVQITFMRQCATSYAELLLFFVVSTGANVDLLLRSIFSISLQIKCSIPLQF